MDNNSRIIVHQNVVLDKSQLKDDPNTKNATGFSNMDRKDISMCLENLDCVTTDFELQLDQHLKNFIVHVTNPNFRKIHNSTPVGNEKTVFPKSKKRKCSVETASNCSSSSFSSNNNNTPKSMNKSEAESSEDSIMEQQRYITRLKRQKMLEDEIIKQSRLRSGRILLKKEIFDNAVEKPISEEDYLITEKPLTIDNLKDKITELNEKIVDNYNFKRPVSRLLKPIVKLPKIETEKITSGRSTPIINRRIKNEKTAIKKCEQSPETGDKILTRSKAQLVNRQLETNIAQNDLMMNTSQIENVQVDCKETEKNSVAQQAEERRKSLRSREKDTKPENPPQEKNYKAIMEENIMNLIIRETEKSPHKYRNNCQIDIYNFKEENIQIKPYTRQSKENADDNPETVLMKIKGREIVLERRKLTRRTSCPYRHSQNDEKRKINKRCSENAARARSEENEFDPKSKIKNRRKSAHPKLLDNDLQLDFQSVYNKFVENDHYCQVTLDRNEIENAITGDSLLKDIDLFLEVENERNKEKKQTAKMSATESNEAPADSSVETINVSTEDYVASENELEVQQDYLPIEIKIEPEDLKTDELDISDYDPVVDLTAEENAIKCEIKVDVEEEDWKREEKHRKINELLRPKVITDKDKLKFDSWKKIVLLDEETVRNFNFDKDCDNFNVFLTFGSFDHLPDFVYNNNDVILKILIDAIQLVEVSLFFERWKNRLL